MPVCLSIKSLPAWKKKSGMASVDVRHLYTIHGGSMTPWICEGDSIEVESLSASHYEKGDVILYQDEKGNLLCHRLVSTSSVPGKACFFQADASPGIQAPVSRNRILGKVIAVWKTNRRLSLEKGWFAFLGRLYFVLSPVLRWIRPAAKAARSLARRIRDWRVHGVRLFTRIFHGPPSWMVLLLSPRELTKFAFFYWPKKIQTLISMPSGLDSLEEQVYEQFLKSKREILVLCSGSGRESLELAGRGHQVLGVEMVPELVKHARRQALERHLPADFLCQTLNRMSLGNRRFDAAVFFEWVYEQIPGRRQRQSILKRIASHLRPGGVVVFQVHSLQLNQREKRLYPLKRCFAACLLGNLEFELGDRSSRGAGFYHAFQNLETVEAELKEAGLTVFKEGFFDEDGVLCYLAARLDEEGCQHSL